MKLENINWDTELELDTEPEQSYVDDNWFVSFVWKNVTYEASCYIAVDVEKSTGIGGSYGEEYETLTNYDVTKAELYLNTIYLDGAEEKLKDFKEIEKQLKVSFDEQH